MTLIKTCECGKIINVYDNECEKCLEQKLERIANQLSCSGCVEKQKEIDYLKDKLEQILSNREDGHTMICDLYSKLEIATKALRVYEKSEDPAFPETNVAKKALESIL